MPKTKLRPTSLAANAAATLEMRKDHWAKITSTLQIIGSGCADKIASHCGLDSNQVGRRMKEMLEQGLVYRTGEQEKTRRGRQADIWCLTNTQPITEGAVEKKLIADTQPQIRSLSNTSIQKSLFGE